MLNYQSRKKGYKSIVVYKYRGYKITQKFYNHEVFVYAPDGRILYSERADRDYNENDFKELLHQIIDRW